MLADLRKIIPPKRIRDSYIDRISFASDAGFYQLIPEAVVQPVSEEEIQKLFLFCKHHQIPLVFRTGGTSLSGQSITDGILVDLTQHWSNIAVEEEGACVRFQPGVIGSLVNARLRKYKRKIGPDPSSIQAAMMGGILSNNSSGMCCGVKLNAYHTMKFVRFMLPDGSVFTTELPADYDRFMQQQETLATTLAKLRVRIISNEPLLSRIRKKYLTKNTVGYSLNALIDYEHPLDIFAHLLVGAEGTLAFISEATLHTVPDYSYKATALLYFSTIFDACQAIMPLTEAGAMMVELMDRASLRAVEDLEGMPDIVKTLPEGAAALLIEFQEDSLEKLQERVKYFLTNSKVVKTLNEVSFTEDHHEREFLWKVRKGLFPAVGAVRASGTTVILEDIAFPVHALGNAIMDLQQLFKTYEYEHAIIFGHAKDGNIHFVITQSLATSDEINRYGSFMQEVVTLVVDRYDGTLKAEHGTGRNMSPFVETEWGSEAYAIMKEIKAVVDPHAILNPGVIINSDANAHLKNFKLLPPVEHEIDRCIECGYCEPACPSRTLTASPRRRIVIRRALKRLQQAGDNKAYNLLLKQYPHEVLDTCAVDGLCAPACPVDINTGDLVKRLRAENHTTTSNRLALTVAKNFGLAVWLLRMTLAVGVLCNRVFGKHALRQATVKLKKVFRGIPAWTMPITPPPSLRVLRVQPKKLKSAQRTIVYFPSCITRAMGTYEGKQKNLMETLLSICEKTNIQVRISPRVEALCCGQVFSSKGYVPAHHHATLKLINTLWHDSNQGEYLVVMDVSSCTYTLLSNAEAFPDEIRDRLKKMKIIDSIDFVHDYVLPLATRVVKKNSIVLHPVCAVKKLKLEEKFLAVAAHFANQVTVPLQAGCCGMAGDRGFLFPELTDAATRDEMNELKGIRFDAYYSSTKTCELALSNATQHSYESILYLVDEGLV